MSWRCPRTDMWPCARLSMYWSLFLPLSLSLSLSLSVSPSPLLLIDLSFCLCIYMSVCLCVCLSIYPPIYLSTYLPTYLPTYLTVCLSVCLSVCLFVCVSTGCRSVMSWQHDERVARRCRPWCLFDVPSCCMTMWLPCCLHATLFSCAVMPWSNINVDMRRFGAVCCRWHVAVLAVLFACSWMMLFLPWSWVNFQMCRFGSVYRRFLPSLSTYPFILLPMYLYVCVSVFLSTYLSICLSVCVSTGCRNMTS